ncbi:MAG: hypothetical protein HY821_11275 [Acidobacteria bacterium]|nr:hypothetical protein [Acidobacteriota bacterium]
MLASGLMWMALAAAQPDELKEELKETIERLRSAPVELQVKGLLSLVEKGAVKDGLGEGGKLDERELIEECFHLAAQAGREMPLRLIGGAQVEDPDARLEEATAQRLDRLTLQAWAVRLMAARDKAKARELMVLLRLPIYRKLECADRTADVPNAYYVALGVILETGFSVKERADGMASGLVRSELAKITSTLQLEALLTELIRLQWTAEEYAAIVAPLGDTLGNLRVDDRTFTATERGLYGLVPKIEQFGLQGKTAGVAADPLAQGLRLFLAGQLSAPRCSDTAANAPAPPAGVRLRPTPPHPEFPDPSLPVVANYFNHKLRLAAWFPSTDLPPLEKEQMTPARLEGAIVGKKIYWSNEREITLKAQELYWGGRTDTPLSLEERSTPEWLRKAAEYRRMIGDYRRAEGQPAESWFLHKTGLMMALWNLMPESPERQEALAEVVRLLASVDKREVGIDLWVFGARGVMDRARRDRKDRSVAPEVLAALVQSGDPALWIVVKMQEWN